MFLLSILFLLPLFGPQYPLPADGGGVAVFATRYPTDATFSFDLEGIDLEKEAATLIISYQGAPEHLGFQFPYGVEVSPRTEGTWKNVTHAGLTYLWCSDRLTYGQLRLTWTGVLRQTAYSTYALVVPFSDNSTIGDAPRDLRHEYGDQISFASLEGNFYSLTVHLSEDASIQTLEPGPVYFGRASDKLRFYWDISKYYSDRKAALTGPLTPGGQPTVYVLFTSNSKQNEKEGLLFSSGLLLGVFVPILFSGATASPSASARDSGTPSSTRSLTTKEGR